MKIFLIKDVPKWVAIIYWFAYKIDIYLWDFGEDLQIFTNRITRWRERLRNKWCTCEQCKERKKVENDKIL